MTLGNRVATLVVAVAFATVFSFGVTVAVTFDWQLRTQLEALLREDLHRVVALLDRPEVGQSLAGSISGGVTLQVLADDGTVVLAWGDPAPLPVVERPTYLDREGRRLLVGQVPWRTANGWVRMAHDVTAPLDSVTRVRLIVLIAGAFVVLVVTVLAVRWSRRMLAPLTDVAGQTRALDASQPGTVTYEGPADEVADLVAGLNDALGAIHHRRERERAFLLEVAHELAAPLSLVDYHLAGLRRRDPDDGASRAAAEAARELLRTSQDLLAVARGEVERALATEIVDLRSVIERIVDEYPGIVVTANGPAEIVGDPERLVQALRNLVRNAVQASGGAHGVRLELTSTRSSHVIHVVDAGGGMHAEARARAFEHGFSGTSGVGVGLTVARDVIVRHGGSIRVVSSTPRGTVMEVVLPSLEGRLTETSGVRDALPGSPSHAVD